MSNTANRAELHMNYGLVQRNIVVLPTQNPKNYSSANFAKRVDIATTNYLEAQTRCLEKERKTEEFLCRLLSFKFRKGGSCQQRRSKCERSGLRYSRTRETLHGRSHREALGAANLHMEIRTQWVHVVQESLSKLDATWHCILDRVPPGPRKSVHA